MFLYEGLLVLQSRGYDSVGIATLSPENDLRVSKYASIETTSECFNKLEKDLSHHSNSTIGIGILLIYNIKNIPFFIFILLPCIHRTF